VKDFAEYTRLGEPDKKEKLGIWQTAIGLQDTDGLKVSSYLISTAKEHIEGDITIDEVQQRIKTYYKTQTKRNKDDRTEEADKVAGRITEILSEKTFSFSPVEFVGIHKRLFDGIYDFAGKIRDYNITKKEWVLNGDTVLYQTAQHLRAALEHDFDKEKKFDYKGLSLREKVERIAEFISGIWQIHPFGEGNTRTTAVFLIKYLRAKGFEPDENMFTKHSWYFRNALVRTNHEHFTTGVYRTNDFLMKFLGNLLLGEENELKNRDMLIGTVNTKNGTVNGTVNLTADEQKVIDQIKVNASTTLEELVPIVGKSIRTIKRIVKSLQDRQIIKRIGSDKKGVWEIR